MKNIKILLGTLVLMGTSAVLAQNKPDGIDKNGDGQISREEAKDRPVLSKHFNTLDTNKDGQLTKQELSEGRKAMREGRQRVMEEGKTQRIEQPTPITEVNTSRRSTVTSTSSVQQPVAKSAVQVYKAQDGEYAAEVWEGLKNVRSLKKGE